MCILLVMLLFSFPATASQDSEYVISGEGEGVTISLANGDIPLIRLKTEDSEKLKILTEIYESLDHFFTVRCPDESLGEDRLLSMNMFYFDAETEKIWIGVKDLDSQKISAIEQSVIGVDSGKFVTYFENYIIPQVTVSSGCAFSTGSVCVPTKDSASGEKGFLTAAHAVGGQGSSVKVGSTKVGTVKYISPAGSGDWAFVKFDSGHSANVGSTGIQATYLNTLSAGTSVTFYGKTSGTITGKTVTQIVNYNMGTWYCKSGYAISGLGTQSGDSGGPLVSTLSGYKCYVGLLSGLDLNGRSLFCSSKETNSQAPNGTGKFQP